MTTITAISGFVFLLLGIAWSKANWQNFAVKGFFLALAIANLYIFLH